MTPRWSAVCSSGLVARPRIFRNRTGQGRHRVEAQGVTLVLLWQEYRAAHPEGYGYTWFCEQFRAFENHTSPSFRNRHEAGAVMQTDYAGHTIPITNPASGGYIRRRSSSRYWGLPATPSRGLR